MLTDRNVEKASSPMWSNSYYAHRLCDTTSESSERPRDANTQKTMQQDERGKKIRAAAKQNVKSTFQKGKFMRSPRMSQCQIYWNELILNTHSYDCISTFYCTLVAYLSALCLNIILDCSRSLPFSHRLFLCAQFGILFWCAIVCAFVCVFHYRHHDCFSCSSSALKIGGT